MTSHVNQDVGLPIGVHALISRSVLVVPTPQHLKESLDRYVIPSVVHFNVFVQINFVVVRVEHLGSVDIPWVARQIIRQHQYDIFVRYSQSLDRVVHRKRVGIVPIIKPVPRR